MSDLFDALDWIVHDGDECPVYQVVNVEIAFRNGDRVETYVPWLYDWSNAVGYRFMRKV